MELIFSRISHMKRFLIFLIAIFLIVGCAPKKHIIKYDVNQSDYSVVAFQEKKLGILVFEDCRPPIEKNGKVGFTDTIIQKDEYFEVAVSEMISNLIVNHCKAYGIETVKLDKKSNEIDLEHILLLENEGVDYILIGQIDHFTQRSYDEHFTARMTGSFCLGCLGPFGLIGMPAMYSGSIDYITEVEFNNLFLIRTDGPAILWRGKCKSTCTKEIKYGMKSPVSKSLELYTQETRKAIQHILDGISLSEKLDYPNKLSIDHTESVISKIKVDGSLANISY